MKHKQLSTQDVEHIANLARLEVSKSQEDTLKKQLSATLAEVEKLDELDTTTTKSTAHVTGLENVVREDQIDPEHMLNQQDALKNAQHSYNDLFKVDAIFSES